MFMCTMVVTEYQILIDLHLLMVSLSPFFFYGLQSSYSLLIVIISSYAVAASDFNQTSKGPLSKVKLHRVILDEAHTIKNKATIAAQGW